MPMNRADYPVNWEEISKQIRFERAQSRCECTGECGCSFDGERCSVEHGQPHPRTGNKVILTVAHLCEGICDAEKTTRLCGEPSHLKAMCQACHLKLDGPLHAANAKETRLNRKDEQRGLLALTATA